MAAIVAYPLKTDISERDASGAGEPDIEPDDQWKEETRKQIEGGLWHFVEEAKQKRDDELSLHSTSPTDQDRVKKEYDDRMAELRKMAEAEFHVLLQYEKKLRRWAVLGETPDPEIVRLQRERMAAIQRNTQQHSESSSAREQGGQSVFKSASTAQSGKAEPAIVDRATNATEARQDDSPTSIAKKPKPLSGISAQFISKAASPVTPSRSHDPHQRAIQRQASIASISSVGSQQEIWKPPSNSESGSTKSRPFIDTSIRDRKPGSFGGGGSDYSSRAASTHVLSRQGSNVDTEVSTRREQAGRDTLEQEWAKTSRAKEKQQEALGQSVGPQLSASDVLRGKKEAGPDSPDALPSFTSQHRARGPQLPNHTPSGQRDPSIRDYSPSTSDRMDIPTKTAFWKSASPQASPEDMRSQPSGVSASRPIVAKQSPTLDHRDRLSHHSPEITSFHGSGGAQPSRSPSNSRATSMKRSDTFGVPNDELRPAAKWLVWSNPAITKPPRRRDSVDSSSLRSQSSRQNLQTPWGGDWSSWRRLASHNEQSVQDYDDDDNLWDDSEYGLHSLEELEDLAQMRRLAEENERRAVELRIREDEVKQREERVQRQAERARKEAEDAKRRQQEARKQAEMAREKEDEAKKLAAVARQAGEETRKQTQEVKRREEEVQRRAEDVRHKEEEVRRVECELRRKEVELEQKQEELRRREEELVRREQSIMAEVRQEHQQPNGCKPTGDHDCDGKAAQREVSSQDGLEGLLSSEELIREQELLWNRAKMKQQQLKQQSDEFQKEQETLRRKHEERKRSGGEASEGNQPATPQSSASSSIPQNIPGRTGSSASSASTDRNSTTSSSFSSVSGFSFSGRSNASTHSTASTTSTTTSTPTAKPASTGWKATGAPPGAPNGDRQSPTPNTWTRTASLDEEEWQRRQEEFARQQQERFQKEQEQEARHRHNQRTKQLTKEEVIRMFEEHERRWARLGTLEVLSWYAFPWPILKTPESLEELTMLAIEAYVLSKHHPDGDKKTSKDRIKDHIKRWHPDRFETKLLPKVREDDRERVKEGAGVVARNLNDLLRRQSSSNALFG